MINIKFLFATIMIFAFLECRELNFRRELNSLKDLKYSSDNISTIIILKFNQNPILISEPRTAKDRIIFFLPLTFINKTAIDYLERINNINLKLSVKIEIIDKPLKGVKIYLMYDPLKINYKIDRQDKEIILRFYDIESLKKIAEKESKNYLYI